MARPRVVAVLFAYVLALQPIMAAALVHVFTGDPVLCSGADQESGLPADHERDTCCAASCCGSTSALAPRYGLVVLTAREAPSTGEPAPCGHLDQQREARARAPPDMLV
jgi:hypothetical protein